MMLFVVRHGETTAPGRYIGRRSDPPLSSKGAAEAAACAERLAGERIDAVYSSTLLRALSTAEQIASRHGLAVEQVPELAEIDFGDWEGLTYDEIGALDAELRDRWLALKRSPVRNASTPAAASLPAPPHSESIPAFDRRVKRALGIIQAAAGSGVAVVTHAGVIRSMARAILHCPVRAHWHIEISLGSISRIRMEPDGFHSIELLNDCHHLGRGE